MIAMNKRMTRIWRLKPNLSFARNIGNETSSELLNVSEQSVLMLLGRVVSGQKGHEIQEPETIINWINRVNFC